MDYDYDTENEDINKLDITTNNNNNNESMTQIDENDSNTLNALDSSSEQLRKSGKSKESLSNQWGLLRNEKLGQEYKLFHRLQDGRKDTYVIGRGKTADICVIDNRISTTHCLIYCDFDQARMRVYIEDQSQNGTYINDSLTKLKCGERTEIRSGYEIFLINPRAVKPGDVGRFLFINMMERIAAQTAVARAPTKRLEQNNENLIRHIEDYYVIGDQLGSGTCGQVHLCVHLESREQCAVKVIDTRKFNLSPGLSVKDLREEAQMMARLDHPNIIRIKDSFETTHTIYIVMELVRGGDLLDRIVERGRYSEDMARVVMLKILNAVDYLHSNDIVHRDLKPENILLVHSNIDTEVKITDFGLAKRTNQEGLKTFCGTPQYFAPEVLKRKGTVTGHGRYGREADMWSLGVVLYILLSGSFPFDEENLFAQIEHAQYSLSGCDWSGVSDQAKHLVRSLLTLSPRERLSVRQAIQHPWLRGEDLCAEPVEIHAVGTVPAVSPTLSPSRINSDSSVTLTENSCASHSRQKEDLDAIDDKMNHKPHPPTDEVAQNSCKEENISLMENVPDRSTENLPMKMKWLRDNAANVLPANNRSTSAVSVHPQPNLASTNNAAATSHSDAQGSGTGSGLYAKVVGPAVGPQAGRAAAVVGVPLTQVRTSPHRRARSVVGRPVTDAPTEGSTKQRRRVKCVGKVSEKKTESTQAAERAATSFGFEPLHLEMKRACDDDNLFEDICEWSSDTNTAKITAVQRDRHQSARPSRGRVRNRADNTAQVSVEKNVSLDNGGIEQSIEKLPMFEPFDDIPYNSNVPLVAHTSGAVSSIVGGDRVNSEQKSWFEELNLLRPAFPIRDEVSSLSCIVPVVSSSGSGSSTSTSAVGKGESKIAIPVQKKRKPEKPVESKKLRAPVRTLTAIFRPGLAVGTAALTAVDQNHDRHRDPECVVEH